MTNEARSLHRKLAEIYAAVDRIPKSGTAPVAMGGFKFVQVGDVADAIRKELAARSITMLPEVAEQISEHVEQTKAGGSMFFQTWRFTWRFSDGESGESCTIQSVGEGSDTHDKGAPKAQTAAMKYALLMAFLVPTGDDPERDAHEEVARPAAKPARAYPSTAAGVQAEIEAAEDRRFVAEAAPDEDDGFAALVAGNTQATRPTPPPPPAAPKEPPTCTKHKWDDAPRPMKFLRGEWKCTAKDASSSTGYCTESRPA